MISWNECRRATLYVRNALIVLLAIVVLAVPACAQEESSASQPNLSPVPAEATKDDYTKALSKMQPITMTVQTLSPKGSLDSRPMERYAEVIEERSGGKIRVETVYSSGIASLADAGQALADGRLDFARHAPLYHPDEFPETNKLVNLSFMGRHTPLVGRLQRFGAFIETAFASDKIINELKGAGLKPAFPLYPTTPIPVVACNGISPTTLEDMEGVLARASGRIHARQLEELGISITDLQLSEIYQGLQRGIINCGDMSLSTLKLIGAIKIASKITFSPKVGIADAPGAVSFSQHFWSSLPLPAKQLLWDGLESFAAEALEVQLINESETMQKFRASGGVVRTWNQDVTKKLKNFNNGIIQSVRKIRPNLVSNLESNMGSWLRVVDKLGYEDGGSFPKLPEWYGAEETSFERYASAFMKDVMVKRRPS